VFYEVSNEKGMGGCDGFKIDKAGNVFIAGALEASGYLPKQVN